MSESIYHWGHIFVTEWLDFCWIPVALAVAHTGHKIKAAAFVLLCIGVLRLQIQIMQSIGFGKGLTGLLDWPLMYRGYVAYGFFIFLHLLMSYYSPRTHPAIYLAASLTIFFVAFAVSSLILVI